MPSGSADDGITRNPHPVVCGDVAPSEPPIEMRWLRGKLVQVSKIPKITQIPCTGNHWLSGRLYVLKLLKLRQAGPTSFSPRQPPSHS